MTFAAWIGMLARNRFAISPRRLPMVIDITICALLNSLFGFLQRVVYGGAIGRTEISIPPVFIIGHWRTGTTWLSEMLALDPQFIAPNTYECLVPAHALLTGPISFLSAIRAPKARPMDGMPVGWERPQEDEFAMMNLGAGSFLETFAFPNRRPVRAEYIDLAGLDGATRQKWVATRIRFMKQVLCRGRREAKRKGYPAARRLLLKSPQDTARLKLLAGIFPGACFIHLVRNPDDIFASTQRLWTALGAAQALETPDWQPRPDGTPSLQEFVLATFERLYRNFWAERQAIPSRQFIDVHYEDLVRDPPGALARIYEHFGWTDFAAARPRLAQYLDRTGKRTVQDQGLPPSMRGLVAERWRDYRDRFGYGSEGREARETLAPRFHSAAGEI
jgi:hypothetical protein